MNKVLAESTTPAPTPPPVGYITTGSCPVCGELFDSVFHPDPEPDGMGMSMLLQPFRQEHARQSPACTKHVNWSRGWDAKTVPADLTKE